MPRYRFSNYVLSPRRRVLARGGAEQPLIPRYFDLLVFLIEHRHEAVHRRDIFDRVWQDVVVSDSALSQAIRTIRRTLGDDSREPRFIRTVSRHGYRFVYDNVLEEEDDGDWTAPSALRPDAAPAATTVTDPFEPLLERLTAKATTVAEEEDQREAAELLHALGTSEALRRLDARAGHAHARAVLRDTRWDVPGAGPVPLAGTPGFTASALALIGLRLRRAARIAAVRAVSASIGGGTAGLLAGVVGGSLLAIAPGSTAPFAVAGVLGAIGGVCGAAGGAGVGAGLAVAEAVARSARSAAVVVGAAAGGGLVGALAQWLGGWTLAAVTGVHVPVGGGIEGVVLGGAAGLGYAMATTRSDVGLAAPRGRQRVTVVATIASACAIAAFSLTLADRPLVGGTVNKIAQASAGAQAMLTPLGRLIGDPDFGPVSRALLGTGEGLVFGLGLATGLTRHRRG